MISLNWETKTWTANVTSDYAKERSAERCATRLAFLESRRVHFFVALLSAALSLNVVYGADALPQSNASSATVLKPRMSFSILESADQKLQKDVFNEVVTFCERPLNTHDGMWYLRLLKLAIGSHLEGVSDLSRFPDDVLGLPTQFQREQWPAFTTPNLLANAEAYNERLISRTWPSSDLASLPNFSECGRCRLLMQMTTHQASTLRIQRCETSQSSHHGAGLQRCP